jgi:hypothetical protein
MDKINKIFQKHGFPQGRMICGSKSGYRLRNPESDVVFNACIFTPEHGSVWNGDLDITLDCKELQKISDKIGSELLITYESVGWYAENKQYDDIEKHGHAKFVPNNDKYYSRIYEGFEGLNTGNMTVITSKGIDWQEIKIV